MVIYISGTLLSHCQIIGSVTGTEGEPLGPEVPQYLVWPASISTSRQKLHHPIKIIDFGQSFHADDRPCTLHTPPALHPPELLLGKDWDYRVDLWAAGCMIFELVAGHPPFDNFFRDKEALLRQILESVGKAPDKWEAAATKGISNPLASYPVPGLILKAGSTESPADNKSAIDIEDWLEELYFNNNDDDDDCKKQDLSPHEIRSLKRLLRKLLCCDPEARYMADIAVRDGWFEDP
ncbi:MAG: hypothetical protein M1819_000240 [Sarea resinae]|nr:MAG: hypothetical protein M1819_000240 [Sarea resinae]